VASVYHLYRLHTDDKLDYTHTHTHTDVRPSLIRIVIQYKMAPSHYIQRFMSMTAATISVTITAFDLRLSSATIRCRLHISPRSYCGHPKTGQRISKKDNRYVQVITLRCEVFQRRVTRLVHPTLRLSL